MPPIVITICVIIGSIMLVLNYFHRYFALRRRKYQIHPFLPIKWIFGNSLTMVFLAASGNFVLMWSTGLMVFLQLILMVLVIVDFRGKPRIWKITTQDYICLGLSITAAISFYFTGDATLGAIINFSGGLIGDIPQLRKAFVAPETDRISVYMISGIRSVIMFGALEQINPVGIIDTLGWASVSFLEIGWLVFCRRRATRIAQTAVLARETVPVENLDQNVSG